MSIRRCTDPSSLQQVWDAIKMLEREGQVPNLENITKYMQDDTGCTPEEVEVLMNNAVTDRLVLENKDVVNRDSKIVVIVESYKIPYQESQKPSYDDRDWYCIECHLAGAVRDCTNCYRVFHSECSKNTNSVATNILKFLKYKPNANLQTSDLPTSKDPSTLILDPVKAFEENLVDLEPFNSSTDNCNNTLDEDLCSICRIENAEQTCSLTQTDLNYLLGFILERIKSWLPVNLTHKMDPQQQEEQWPSSELDWRASRLWVRRVNMEDIQRKINCDLYSKLTEFQADVMLVRHNVAIFHGFESQEYGAAELMLRDCCHELSELCVCADCYRHSNEKLNNNWFCLPCKIPHKLVWAKQKGYPYWPAKVIRETNSMFDVRFFGGKYERSVLPAGSIKPIDTPMKELHVKHNGAFKKSLDELRLHRTLLGDEAAVERLRGEGKRRRAEKAKRQRRGSGAGKATPKKGAGDAARDVYDFPDEPENAPSPAKMAKKKVQPPKTYSMKKPKTDNHVVEVKDDDAVLSPLKDDVFNADTNIDQVTSSTEYVFAPDDSSDTPMQELDQPYSDVIERMRRKLELETNRDDLILTAMNSMREEITRMRTEYEDRFRKLKEAHSNEIAETKRKQWCYNCQRDAIYHCCWNTAYCSQDCQQLHWQSEHKKVCRRKR